MSLSTSFLNSASFLSLKACQAAFSFPSIAALSGVAAMETAMAPKEDDHRVGHAFFHRVLSLRVLQIISRLRPDGQDQSVTGHRTTRLNSSIGTQALAPLQISRNNGSGFKRRFFCRS